MRGALSRMICLALVAAALEASGRALPAPSSLSVHGLSLWWSRLGPVTATFAAGRLTLTVLVAIWLAALVTSVVVLVILRSGRAVPLGVRSCLDWSSARPWRRFLLVALGLSVSTGSLAACGGAGSDKGVSSGGRSSVPAAPLLVGPATRTVAPVIPDRSPPTTPAIPARQRAVATTLPRPPVAGHDDVTTGPDTWIVGPGDDFWSIAEAVVARENAPSPSAVGRYWSALLAANKDRLPVPGDPNLLFPGDRILLPPPGRAAG